MIVRYLSVTKVANRFFKTVSGMIRKHNKGKYELYVAEKVLRQTTPNGVWQPKSHVIDVGKLPPIATWKPQN